MSHGPPEGDGAHTGMCCSIFTRVGWWLGMKYLKSLPQEADAKEKMGWEMLIWSPWLPPRLLVFSSWGLLSSLREGWPEWKLSERFLTTFFLPSQNTPEAFQVKNGFSSPGSAGVGVLQVHGFPPLNTSQLLISFHPTRARLLSLSSSSPYLESLLRKLQRL